MSNSSNSRVPFRFSSCASTRRDATSWSSSVPVKLRHPVCSSCTSIPPERSVSKALNKLRCSARCNSACSASSTAALSRNNAAWRSKAATSLSKASLVSTTAADATRCRLSLLCCFTRWRDARAAHTSNAADPAKEPELGPIVSPDTISAGARPVARPVLLMDEPRKVECRQGGEDTKVEAEFPAPPTPAEGRPSAEPVVFVYVPWSSPERKSAEALRKKPAPAKGGATLQGDIEITLGDAPVLLTITV
mmetsp:Transcript_122588/g.261608  ORF Transcript_122588/g.261608 Transcript_122588/m.261608 type:complete len:249 (-) Transcript_122588:49-795(-)